MNILQQIITANLNWAKCAEKIAVEFPENIANLYLCIILKNLSKFNVIFYGRASNLYEISKEFNYDGNYSKP